MKKISFKFVTKVAALEGGGVDITSDDGEVVFVGPGQSVIVEYARAFEYPDGLIFKEMATQSRIVDNRPKKTV